MTVDITSRRAREVVADVIARIPECPADHIQIVALTGVDAFIAWTPVARVERLLASVEGRFALTDADRTDRMRQAALRIEVAGRLAARDDAAFTDHLGALCLWLCVNHWRDAAAMNGVIDRNVTARGRCVVTVGIADRPGWVAGTAWACMAGPVVDDGRERLLGMAPGEVATIIDHVAEGRTPEAVGVPHAPS